MRKEKERGNTYLLLSTVYFSNCVRIYIYRFSSSYIYSLSTLQSLIVYNIPPPVHFQLHTHTYPPTSICGLGYRDTTNSDPSAVTWRTPLSPEHVPWFLSFFLSFSSTDYKPVYLALRVHHIFLSLSLSLLLYTRYIVPFILYYYYFFFWLILFSLRCFFKPTDIRRIL